MEIEDQNFSDNIHDLYSFRFIENYYFSLPSQGNVYTLVTLKSSSKNCKVLVASLQKKIFCFEYDNGNYTFQENPLPCVPNGADIVSMNACGKNDKYTVGVTMVLKDGANEQSLLNLYSDWDLSKPIGFNPEITNYTSIQLGFVPYVLIFTTLPTTAEKEIVWLLSGGDRRIHLFRPLGDNARYQESTATASVFPEFSRVHGITLHMDIFYSEDMKSRYTVTTGESGNVHMFFVDVSDPTNPLVKSSREISFDFPVSSAKIFHRRNKRPPSFTDLDIDLSRQTDEDLESNPEPLILVTTTLESSFVYCGVDPGHPGYHLPTSEDYDVVTCCLVCDVDFDSVNEIVLGTYGQTLLIYKEVNEGTGQWRLMLAHALPSPILALAYEDVLGDGVRELIVSTMAGVHVLQVDPAYVAPIILNRLRKIRLLND